VSLQELGARGPRDDLRAAVLAIVAHPVDIAVPPT